MKRLICAAGCAVFGLATTAHADEDRKGFSYEVLIEIENDSIVDTSDGENINDTFATIEAALSYGFTQNTSVNASLTFEPIRDSTDDRFFEDQGLYAEELYLFHDFGGLQVVLGKFNPTFGFAWDAAPGVFGVDFAEDYEITERLGGSVIVPFEAIGNEHELEVSLFNADRTFLSGSIIAERDQVELSDGGVSNTNSPDSFNIALSGKLSETSYTLAFQNQARGRGDTRDQTGGVLGVIHDFGAVEVLAEAAYFDTYDGADASAFYGTLGFSVPVTDKFGLSASYTYRDIDDVSEDHLATVSAEYEIIDNLALSVAYRYGDEENVRTHTIGTLLAFTF